MEPSTVIAVTTYPPAMERDPAAGYLTDVAYIPGFYPQMAPVMLRFATALNGVAPPAPSGFRYLELGCGPGRSRPAA